MLVCFCKEIPKDEILISISKGNDTVDLIQADTEACTMCGCCSFEIEEILEDLKTKKGT